MNRVSDLSVDEFRELIREVMLQTLIELFHDPDEGLDLRKNFKAALQKSLQIVEAGGGSLSMENVSNKLRLNH